MDESELQEYEDVVFGDDPFTFDPMDYKLVKQIYDEDGPVEGCYITVPAPVEW